MPATQQFATIKENASPILRQAPVIPSSAPLATRRLLIYGATSFPQLEGCGRSHCPDLIGQGDSEKLPASDGRRPIQLFRSLFEYLDGLLHEH